MAMQPGRFEKRIGAAVAVMLTSADPAFPTELTVTQDTSSRGARIVTKELWRADDSLVIKSLDRNKILINFSHIDPQQVRTAFLERMRNRYGKTVDAHQVGISQGDWRAFRFWAENSPADKDIEQAFWRRFVGSSRKRLGQAPGFLFPVGYSWSEDPRQILENLFPLAEATHLIDSLADDGLDENETAT